MRYTPEQLREMAQHSLAARDLGDVRWMLLVMTLATVMEMAPPEVEQRIQALANG